MKKMRAHYESLYHENWEAAKSLLVCTLSRDRVNRHHNLGWRSLCPVIPAGCLFSYRNDRVFIMVGIGTPFQLLLLRKGNNEFRVEFGPGCRYPVYLTSVLDIEKSYRRRCENVARQNKMLFLDKEIKPGSLSPMMQSISNQLSQ